MASSLTPTPAPRLSRKTPPIPLPRKHLGLGVRKLSQSDDGHNFNGLDMVPTLQENIYESDESIFNRIADPFGEEFESSLGISTSSRASDVFSSISFSSPLFDEEEGDNSSTRRCSFATNYSSSEDDKTDNYDDDSIERPPPSYSPPPLPDESLYDCIPASGRASQMSNASYENVVIRPKNTAESPYGKINRKPVTPQLRTAPLTPPTRMSVIREFDPLFTPGEPPRETLPMSIFQSDITENAANEAVERSSRRRLISIQSDAGSDRSSWESVEQNRLYSSVQKRSDGSNGLKDSFRRKMSILRLGSRNDKNSQEESAEVSRGATQRYIPSLRCDLHHSSHIFRTNGARGKDFQSRWLVLNDGHLVIFTDKNARSVQDDLVLENMLSVRVFSEPRVSPDLHDLHCFDVQFVTSKSKPSTSVVLFGALSDQVRRKWMQVIASTVTAGSFPSTLLASYERLGWAFVKEGVSGTWTTCWLLLRERHLYYCFHGTDKMERVDLRKARKVALHPKGAGYRCPHTAHSSEVLVVDVGDGSAGLSAQALYVQSESDAETQCWKDSIHASAVKNGLGLSQMQLTHDDVPVLVDKCIKFVYTHGSLQEGVYRQSGANSRITEILQRFEKDAWAVHLSPDECVANDVAGALKRFFRSLPEALLTEDLYEQWIATSELTDTNERIDGYRALLARLPHENFRTLRAVIAHLYLIGEQCQRNLMPVSNLAPIWGPTLLFAKKPVRGHNIAAEAYGIAGAEMTVASHLIEMFPVIFSVSEEELQREKKIQEALVRLQEGRLGQKASGDVRVWIHVFTSESTAQGVTLAPNTTACSVCHELLGRMNLTNDADEVTLWEVVGKGALERPMHYSEKALDAILRWRQHFVKEEDAKDNYLVVKSNTLYKKVESLAKHPLSLFLEVYYTEPNRSSKFRRHLLEFSQAKMVLYRDANGTTRTGRKTSVGDTRIALSSWNVEDLVWYLGCEERRKPPTKWSLTFAEKSTTHKRSKDVPHYGKVVCCDSEEDLLRFVAALLVAEHPAGLWPVLPLK